MSKFRRAAIVGIPFVAVATLAFGLRIGASTAIHSAIVYAAPLATESSTLTWQVMTIREDHNVRETFHVPHLHVSARAGDSRAVWDGESNRDGIAEIQLELQGIHTNEDVDLEIVDKDESVPLARGKVEWKAVDWGLVKGGDAWVHPTNRTGDLDVDVAIYSSRLTPGYPTSVGVHVSDRFTGVPLGKISIDATGEGGIQFTTPSAVTCDVGTTDQKGWAEISATAAFHVAAVRIHAQSPAGRTGEWFGSFPVAVGAPYVAVPEHVEPDERAKFEVVGPAAQNVAYVEIDDPKGRAFGAVVPLVMGKDQTARGMFEGAPLPEGSYWLVASTDPRGAQNVFTGGTTARPFTVAHHPPEGISASCSIGARVGLSGVFQRWVALDGVSDRREHANRSRMLGFAIALLSVIAAAILEAIILLNAVHDAHERLKVVADLIGQDTRAARMLTHSSVGSVIVGLLVAMLGFGLLASMLLWRSG